MEILHCKFQDCNICNFTLKKPVLLVSKMHCKFAGDAVCNASGFGFNGYDSHGLPKWDLCTNVNILGIEVRCFSFFHEHNGAKLRYSNTIQGSFCPSLGAEFRPHSQSKIATHFFSNTMSVFPNYKEKKFPFFFLLFLVYYYL